MTKTTWIIIDKTTNTKTELIYYHFSKEPKFPTCFMEAGHSYTIEMIWNFKLVNTLSAFFKCLTHFYIIK